MTPEQFDECTKLVADILLRFQPRDDIKDGLSDHDAGWLLDIIEATVKAHGFFGQRQGRYRGPAVPYGLVDPPDERGMEAIHRSSRAV